MKFIRSVLFFLALAMNGCLPVVASNVTFYTFDNYGNQLQTNRVTLSQVGQPLLYGGTVAYGTPKVYAYTNGSVTVSNLVGGTWIAALGGVNKLIPLVIPPNDSNTWNFTTLTTSNLAYYAKLLNIFAYWPTNLDAWAQVSPSAFLTNADNASGNNLHGTNVSITDTNGQPLVATNFVQTSLAAAAAIGTTTPANMTNANNQFIGSNSFFSGLTLGWQQFTGAINGASFNLAQTYNPLSGSWLSAAYPNAVALDYSYLGTYAGSNYLERALGFVPDKTASAPSIQRFLLFDYDPSGNSPNQIRVSAKLVLNADINGNGQNITNANFSGNGSGLTSIDASQVARVITNTVQVSGSNLLVVAVTNNGVITYTVSATNAAASSGGVTNWATTTAAQFAASNNIVDKPTIDRVAWALSRYQAWGVVSNLVDVVPIYASLNPSGLNKTLLGNSFSFSASNQPVSLDGMVMSGTNGLTFKLPVGITNYTVVVTGIGADSRTADYYPNYGSYLAQASHNLSFSFTDGTSNGLYVATYPRNYDITYFRERNNGVWNFTNEPTLTASEATIFYRYNGPTIFDSQQSGTVFAITGAGGTHRAYWDTAPLWFGAFNSLGSNSFTSSASSVYAGALNTLNIGIDTNWCNTKWNGASYGNTNNFMNGAVGLVQIFNTTNIAVIYAAYEAAAILDGRPRKDLFFYSIIDPTFQPSEPSPNNADQYRSTRLDKMYHYAFPNEIAQNFSIAGYTMSNAIVSGCWPASIVTNAPVPTEIWNEGPRNDGGSGYSNNSVLTDFATVFGAMGANGAPIKLFRLSSVWTNASTAVVATSFNTNMAAAYDYVLTNYQGISDYINIGPYVPQSFMNTNGWTYSEDGVHWFGSQRSNLISGVINMAKYHQWNAAATTSSPAFYP
jgi:hypothetical protein